MNTIANAPNIRPKNGPTIFTISTMSRTKAPISTIPTNTGRRGIYSARGGMAMKAGMATMEGMGTKGIMGIKGDTETRVGMEITTRFF